MSTRSFTRSIPRQFAKKIPIQIHQSFSQTSQENLHSVFFHPSRCKSNINRLLNLQERHVIAEKFRHHGCTRCSLSESFSMGTVRVFSKIIKNDIVVPCSVCGSITWTHWHNRVLRCNPPAVLLPIAAAADATVSQRQRAKGIERNFPSFSDQTLCSGLLHVHWHHHQLQH